MANEQKNVGDPCVYFLRIDMGFNRTPEECDALAKRIGTDVFMNFRVKGVTFCSDVELKEMFGMLYQKAIDEATKNWIDSFPSKRNDTATEPPGNEADE